MYKVKNYHKLAKALKLSHNIHITNTQDIFLNTLNPEDFIYRQSIVAINNLFHVIAWLKCVLKPGDPRKHNTVFDLLEYSVDVHNLKLWDLELKHFLAFLKIHVEIESHSHQDIETVRWAFVEHYDWTVKDCLEFLDRHSDRLADLCAKHNVTIGALDEWID